MADADTTKPCQLCAETIPNKARKCKHCDGFQGYLFFLNVGVPVLSLLVALVSVVSLAGPSLVALFSEPESDVRVSFQYFRDGAAHFVASNSGDRPGTISEAYFDYGPQKKRHDLALSDGSQLVRPGDNTLLKFDLLCSDERAPQVQYAVDEGFGSRPISDSVTIHIEILQFDGDRSQRSFEIAQLSALRAINDRGSDCFQRLLRGPQGQ